MDKAPKFKLLPDTGTDITETCPIQILDGEFKDIIYRYGRISFEETPNGLNVTMEIDIIDGPKGFNKETPEFSKAAGEIFVQLVEEKVTAEPVDLEDDVHQDSVDNF